MNPGQAEANCYPESLHKTSPKPRKILRVLKHHLFRDSSKLILVIKKKVNF